MSDKELGPGSEGDAYRYTKKVLVNLPNVDEIRHIYTEIACNRGISSWTRACYEELRRQFFRDGQCKIKFAPGLARIAFGELLFGTGDEDFRELADLRDFLRIISIAHFTEFSRHLAVDGKNLTFKDLVDRFGSTVSGNWKEMKRELARIKYGPRRYRVIWLDSFATANQYHKYTLPHGWCHLSSKSMFKSYSFNTRFDAKGKKKISVVKLYLAVLPGFETMTEDDPLYGESMLGIDIGPDGRLMHVNNRWNHAHDNVDERKGDNKYSERELSELMGGPFYKLCPAFSKKDYRHVESIMKRARKKENGMCLRWVKKLAEKVSRAASAKCGARQGRFVDARDGREYRTGAVGTLEWMLEPMSYIGMEDVRNAAALDSSRATLEEEWKTYDAEFGEHTCRPEGTLAVYNAGAVGDPDRPDGDADGLDEQCILDYSAPELPTVDHYEPITAIDIDRDGHAKVYRTVDVCKMSAAREAQRAASTEYLRKCEEYRNRRAEKFARGAVSADPADEEGRRTMIIDRGYVCVATDDNCEVELITPLGFEETVAKPLLGCDHRLIVNDMDEERNFVFYDMRSALEAVPPGWRLPSVYEFMSMAMAKGAKFDFHVYRGSAWKTSKFSDDAEDHESLALDKTAGVAGLKAGLAELMVDKPRPPVDRIFPDDTEELETEQTPEDPDEDATQVVVDTGNDITTENAEPDGEYGFDLDSAVPNLKINLPSIGFSMKEAGFSYPADPRKECSIPFTRDEPVPETALPILLKIDGISGMTPAQWDKVFRKFNSYTTKFGYYRDVGTDELEDALNELVTLQTAHELQEGNAGDALPNIPYACAKWNPGTQTFSISIGMRMDGTRDHFMVYCVKDRKKPKRVAVAG